MIKILLQGDFIRGGGHFVLAQEQDWDTEEKQFTYNPYEAFIGDMSQMTVWNTVLSSQDIYNLAGSCLNSRNDALVVSWGDFVPELTGDYRKTTESSACRCKSYSQRSEIVTNKVNSSYSLRQFLYRYKVSRLIPFSKIYFIIKPLNKFPKCIITELYFKLAKLRKEFLHFKYICKACKFLGNMYFLPVRSSLNCSEISLCQRVD